MLFGHKNRLQVELGDLEKEREQLSIFLQLNLNANVSQVATKLLVDSEKISVVELEQAVAKYVHRHNLSRTHWVSIQDKTVKINKFKNHEKKKEKNNKKRQRQTITQSWGL